MKTICRACRKGQHDKCWIEWASMNMNSLELGPNVQCRCSHQETQS